MKISSATLALWTAFLVALIGGGAWFGLRSDERDALRPPSLMFGSVYSGAALSGEYRNETFRFSLDVPEGFTASELPPDENDATAIIIQDKNGEGIQIFVTPDAGNQNVLTAADVRASIPDMEVKDAQPVEIGDDYRGVAFLSDNDAFGGESREVWFYFHGNLYQISTYARLDGLLQAMFATWEFF